MDRHQPPAAAAPAARLRPRRWALPPDDLLRLPDFRRIWLSSLVGNLGMQIAVLALPLAAAVLLQASPVQMGWLTALEVLPVALFSLPAGVWLDRVRKLPIYVGGEWTLALAAASVPLAWALGLLAMPWLYAVAFVLGLVNAFAGSAAQIVMVQVVGRPQLVQAHAKNALAGASAEVAGPALAGMLMRGLGAPLTLLVVSALLLASAGLLRGLVLVEHISVAPGRRFARELREGLGFVLRQRLLLTLALMVAVWHLCFHCAVVVQILLASRTLALSAQAIGLCYVAMGGGTVLGGIVGDRISRRIGPGPCLSLGLASCALAWWAGAVDPPAALAVPAFVAMLVLLGLGTVLVFINFLAIRQALTPPHLLGRMTATVRWIILLPALPGALLGGWLGEHLGLRAPLWFAATLGTALALLAWRSATVRAVRRLPAAVAA